MSGHSAEGRCLCGNIRYRIKASPRWSGYCHCVSCRRFTGALVTSWLGIDSGDIEFMGTKPAIFEISGVRRGFCPDCGSSLTYESNRFPGYLQLHIGSLDDRVARSGPGRAHCAVVDDTGTGPER